jgi:recombination protein RecA
MGFEDFLSRLDPKTAKRIKTAQETEVVFLPTASHGLNKILNGGVAKGRICLVYGNQSAGKSMLFQQSVGKWQKEGLVCAWVDTEGAWDKNWAAKLGVNNDELILVQSKSSGRIEKEIAPYLENHIDVIVIDSISDIMPEAFIGKDGSLNDQEDRKQIGAHAKAITALINGILYRNEDTAIVLLSQTTTFLGQTYVQQVPHGGKKALFAASQIVKLTSSNTDAKQIKGNVYVGDLVLQKPIGRTVDAFCEKNKLGSQHGTCEYDIYYGGESVGIDYVGEVIKEAVEYAVINKAGAWFKWNGQQWQGEENTTKHFKEHGDDLDKLLNDIRMVETGEVPEDE